MVSNMATSTTMFPAFHHLNVMIFVSILRFMDVRKTLMIKTTLDITELLNHYEIEFMTFSCPLSSPNAQCVLGDDSGQLKVMKLHKHLCPLNKF